MTPDTATLRALAQAATNDTSVVLYSQGDPCRTIAAFSAFATKAEYHVACDPQTILTLLDRLTALEAVAEAARTFLGIAPDDDPCSDDIWSPDGRALMGALAAIEGEAT